MGRSADFRGAAAYGNFEPKPVDIDLAEPKVTDHPHYGQAGDFHDPDQPMSDTCLQCGQHRSLHTRVHLPPTRQGYDDALQMIEQHKTGVREGKAKEAREADQESKTRASQYGLGGSKALRRHLAESHELMREDANEMERPAYFHRLWHTMGDYTPDGHTH
jgi:hypothetical protein